MNRASTALLVVLIFAACGDERPAGPASAESAALRLFDLARSAEPSEELIAALFGEDLEGRRRTSLLESLGSLSSVTAVEVAGSERLEELGRVAVDLKARLPAGGMAAYSVQLEPTAQGQWRILWFQGPGVEWPPRERPRGEGLTTSAPPAGESAP